MRDQCRGTLCRRSRGDAGAEFVEDLSGARGILRSARTAFVADQQSCLSVAAQRWVESRRALYEDPLGDVSAGADSDLRGGQRQLRKKPVADCGFCAQRENAAAGNL